MESRIATLEEKVVDLKSWMDAIDATVSGHRKDIDNVRRELYQQNEAFMAQS